MSDQDDLSRKLSDAEAAMASAMRGHMGSATEQHERVEALIEALGQPGAAGIDRTPAQWWKTPPAENT